MPSLSKVSRSCTECGFRGWVRNENTPAAARFLRVGTGWWEAGGCLIHTTRGRYARAVPRGALSVFSLFSKLFLFSLSQKKTFDLPSSHFSSWVLYIPRRRNYSRRVLLFLKTVIYQFLKFRSNHTPSSFPTNPVTFSLFCLTHCRTPGSALYSACLHVLPPPPCITASGWCAETTATRQPCVPHLNMIAVSVSLVTNIRHLSLCHLVFHTGRW